MKQSWWSLGRGTTWDNPSDMPFVKKKSRYCSRELSDLDLDTAMDQLKARSDAKTGDLMKAVMYAYIYIYLFLN